MAAYVKFVESAGGVPVPLQLRHLNDSQIEDFVGRVNGLLIPGGGTKLQHANGSLTEWSRKVKVAYDKAKSLNDNGVHFPIWAVCMGFQLIHAIEAPFPGVVMYDYFTSVNEATNLQWVSDARSSRLFADMPDDLIHKLETEPLTFENHHDGILLDAYSKFPELTYAFWPLAIATDPSGSKYLAVVEHRAYPIFSVQFHPEKSTTVWLPNLPIPHSPDAIRVTQYFANFLIAQARLNENSFGDWTEL